MSSNTDNAILTTQLEIIELIGNIYKQLDEPWDFDVDKPTNAITRYKDKDGRTHFSKLMRNNMFSQRLFRIRDEVNEAVCRINIATDQLTVTTNKQEADLFVKAMEANHIQENVYRASTYYLNALSYFFDFPIKDNAFNVEEIINFTYMRNEKICNSITSIVDSEEFKVIQNVIEELNKGYFGVPIISGEDPKPPTIHTAFRYQQDVLIDASVKVLSKINESLKVLNSQITDVYKTSLGYSSANDIVVEEGHNTTAWIGSVYPEQPEPYPFKIYNYWDSLGVNLETAGYSIKKNLRYKQLLEGKYRSSDHVTHSFKYKSDQPVETEIKIDKAQEGTFIWTHTIDFKKRIKSNSYKKNAIEEACLILSWVTGSGVYGDATASSYSHKAKGDTKYKDYEVARTFNQVNNAINKSNKIDKQFLKLLLSRYRQAMQPSATNGKLVKLWEIIDVLGDYYCTDPRKSLPAGFDDYKVLRKTIASGLSELGKTINVPLIGQGAFTPILIDKSIASKVNDLLTLFGIADLVNVDVGALKKSVNNVYGLRSKLTHSSDVDFKDKKTFYKLINTYFFISDLLFLITSQILHLPDSDSLHEVRYTINGFINDDNHYIKRHRRISRQSKKMDDMFKIMSGEMPWPTGKKSISF